jgi:hypothetical protein
MHTETQTLPQDGHQNQLQDELNEVPAPKNNCAYPQDVVKTITFGAYSENEMPKQLFVLTGTGEVWRKPKRAPDPEWEKLSPEAAEAVLNPTFSPEKPRIPGFYHAKDKTRVLPEKVYRPIFIQRDAKQPERLIACFLDDDQETPVEETSPEILWALAPIILRIPS